MVLEKVIDTPERNAHGSSTSAVELSANAASNGTDSSSITRAAAMGCLGDTRSASRSPATCPRLKDAIKPLQIAGPPCLPSSKTGPSTSNRAELSCDVINATMLVHTQLQLVTSRKPAASCCPNRPSDFAWLLGRFVSCVSSNAPAIYVTPSPISAHPAPIVTASTPA